MSTVDAPYYVAGIDVGGTKIAGGVISSEDPTTVLHCVTIPTPPGKVVPAIIEVVEALKEQSEGPINAIGVGAPGVIDHVRGTVVFAGPNMPQWQGTQVVQELTAQLGIPSCIANDARVLALGETLYGAGQARQCSCSNVLFVSIGTGIGGALVRRGALLDSPHGTAGELRGIIGRNAFNEPQIIEEFASGPGMAAAYERLTGESTTFHVVGDRAEAGDPVAAKLVDTTMYNLGEALAGFITAVDVDVVIVGGGVGNIGPLIVDPLTRGLRETVMEPLSEIDICVAGLGRSAPIIGAASLCLNSPSSAV